MTQDLNLQSLRQAAEAALHTGEWYNAGCGTVHDGEHDEVAHPCDTAAVAHIIEAQPATILALLDRLERETADLAAEKRKSLELARVYEERGRQIARLESRGSPAGAAVPEDHLIAPLESTSKMDDAGLLALPDNCTYTDAEDCYKAMIGAYKGEYLAAPAAPSQQPKAPDGWIGQALVQGELTSVAFKDEATARRVCAKGEPFAFYLAAPSAPTLQPTLVGVKLDVIARSYGFVLSVDGELLGLTAGDQGYEQTGIWLEGSDLATWKAACAEPAPVAQASQQPVYFVQHAQKGKLCREWTEVAGATFSTYASSDFTTRVLYAAPLQQAEGAMGLLIELNDALRKAWDARELPASVISGDLTRRVYAFIRASGNQEDAK